MFFSTSNLFDSDMILTVRTANPSKRIIAKGSDCILEHTGASEWRGGISVIADMWRALPGVSWW